MTEKISVKKPDPIDIHVGKRLRTLRKILGISQEKLAEQVNLTFQQVQKYERGMNRVSASRLYNFAKILDVPVSYFFRDMGKEIEYADLDTYGHFSDTEQEEFETAVDKLYDRDTLELTRLFYSIEDDEVRKQIIALVRSMARTINKNKADSAE
jgi:transcriptional regulator with XRE-family HTH domain